MIGPLEVLAAQTPRRNLILWILADARDLTPIEAAMRDALIEDLCLDSREPFLGVRLRNADFASEDALVALAGRVAAREEFAQREWDEEHKEDIDIAAYVRGAQSIWARYEAWRAGHES